MQVTIFIQVIKNLSCLNLALQLLIYRNSGEEKMQESDFIRVQAAKLRKISSFLVAEREGCF